jgi:hypothetical protein
MGDSRDTHTVGAAGDSEGGGVAGVMELGAQQGHPHSGSSRGLRGRRGSRGYGGWGTAGTPTGVSCRNPTADRSILHKPK